MPPELFKRSGVLTDKCDVYSFGIKLWELLTEKVPFEDKGLTEIGKLSLAIIDGVRPDIPSVCPTLLATLINECWAQEANKRPLFSEIVSNNGQKFSNIVLEALTQGNKEYYDFWASFGQDNNGKPLDKVPWNKFLRKFLSFLGIKAEKYEIDGSIEILCVKESLSVKDNDENVTIANFEKFLSLYPPINKGIDYLHQIKDLLKEDWFFGEMDGDTATNHLNGCKKESFLVRFSATNKNMLTVSQKKRKRSIT